MAGLIPVALIGDAGSATPALQAEVLGLVQDAVNQAMGFLSFSIPSAFIHIDFVDLPDSREIALTHVGWNLDAQGNAIPSGAMVVDFNVPEIAGLSAPALATVVRHEVEGHGLLGVGGSLNAAGGPTGQIESVYDSHVERTASGPVLVSAATWQLVGAPLSLSLGAGDALSQPYHVPGAGQPGGRVDLMNPTLGAAIAGPSLVDEAMGELDGDSAPVTDPRLFNAAYYLAHNPDVAAWAKSMATDPNMVGVLALGQFRTFGSAEGRDPSAYFNDSAYLAANPDIAGAVAAGRTNALDQYVAYGMAEGRQVVAVAA